MQRQKSGHYRKLMKTVSVSKKLTNVSYCFQTPSSTRDSHGSPHASHIARPPQAEAHLHGQTLMDEVEELGPREVPERTAKTGPTALKAFGKKTRKTTPKTWTVGWPSGRIEKATRLWFLSLRGFLSLLGGFFQSLISCFLSFSWNVRWFWVSIRSIELYPKHDSSQMKRRGPQACKSLESGPLDPTSKPKD